jgi:deoxyribose-phosphate aldolase
MSELTPTQVAALIDHTLLKPDATESDIRKLCAEAREYGFASVCINPSWVPLAAKLLNGAKSKVCTVIGFPLGATSTIAKVCESEEAIADGAKELDMVINVGLLKSGNSAGVEHDIRAICEAAHKSGVLSKVIIETCLLTQEEKILASQLAKAAGADFVKTSTGFSTGGATAADVKLMRDTVGPSIGVKASGGIRTLSDLRAMVAAGATRIGASAGVKIVEEARSGSPGTSSAPASTSASPKNSY